MSSVEQLGTSRLWQLWTSLVWFLSQLSHWRMDVKDSNLATIFSLRTFPLNFNNHWECEDEFKMSSEIMYMFLICSLLWVKSSGFWGRFISTVFHLDQLTMNTYEMTENRRTKYPEMYQSSRMYITHGAVEEGSSHPLTLCPPLKKTLVINWINLHEHLA